MIRKYLSSSLFAGFIVALVMASFIVAPASLAIAQDAAAVGQSPSTVYLAPLVGGLIPYAIELFLMGIFALLGLIAAWVKRKWNIDAERALKEIEARHRDSLHSAIKSGVAAWMTRTKIGDKLEFDIGSDGLAYIANHVAKSVPEAREFFKPTPEVIARIASAKAMELPASAALFERVDF